MPHLDFANPLHTFTSNNLSFTATQECYLVGVMAVPSDTTLSINGTAVGRASVFPNEISTVPTLKLESGDVVTVTQAVSEVHIFKAL